MNDPWVIPFLLIIVLLQVEISVLAWLGKRTAETLRSLANSVRNYIQGNHRYL